MNQSVTQMSDQLKAQPTGQPAFPIFPESSTHFFYKVVLAEIYFDTNAEGEVTGLVLHQNGRNIPGKKVQ